MIKHKAASIFLKGLLTLLPIYLTVYFVVWLAARVEATFRGFLESAVGNYYFPGLGLLTGIVIVFLIGIFMQIYIAQYISGLIDKLIQKLPLIGELYSSIQSLTKYLSSSHPEKGQEVVMVEVNGMEVLGIVTRTDFSQAPEGVVEKEQVVSVYVPMSYQVGGFTLYVNGNQLRPVDMSQKAALKWALIGGIQM